MVRNKFEGLLKELHERVVEECEKNNVACTPTVELIVIKSALVEDKLYSDGKKYQLYMEYVRDRMAKMLSKCGELDNVAYQQELVNFDFNVALNKLEVIHDYRKENL